MQSIERMPYCDLGRPIQSVDVHPVQRLPRSFYNVVLISALYIVKKAMAAAMIGSMVVLGHWMADSPDVVLGAAVAVATGIHTSVASVLESFIPSATWRSNTTVGTHYQKPIKAADAAKEIP